VTTLLDLVQEDTALTYRNGEWHGLCPLHQEKTASFSVNDERGLFHCFGCGAGGDLVSYLVEKRGLSMREALTRAGKVLPQVLTSASEIRKQTAHDRLLAEYLTWWHDTLKDWNRLLESLYVAEVAYRSMCRSTDLWTEDEQTYWSTRLGRLYAEYDAKLQDINATDAERFARWQETRNTR
jgi:DNA primase